MWLDSGPALRPLPAVGLACRHARLVGIEPGLDAALAPRGDEAAKVRETDFREQRAAAMVRGVFSLEFGEGAARLLAICAG